MAYNAEDLTKLGQLKQLAQRMKTEQDDTNTRITELEQAGGQPNVIETVKVNGTAQTVTDKAVNISVPTKVSQLNNDSKFQKDTEVAAAIQTAISKSGHASFTKADAVPAASAAKENILYLVMNSTTNHYDIYAKVGDEVVLLDDTTVDLSGYVQKVAGKGLSTNDYTNAEKQKLEGLENYVHETHSAHASGFYKITVNEQGHVTAAAAVTKADITKLGIPAQDTTYSAATQTAPGLMPAADKKKLDGMQIATDAEVTEMLDEIFGA